jgi:restriction endonuclease S subunit
MSRALSDISALFTGLTIRNRSEISDAGPVRLVQPRSIVAGPRIDLANTDTIEDRVQTGRQRLIDGDLVLRTRGSRFEAARFVSDGVPTVASAPLIVLRPSPERVSPEYLQWLLNESPEVRRAMGHSMRGSTVQALNIEDLSKIEVPLPSLERQQAIVEAARLARRAAEIEQRLSELRRLHTARALSDAAKESTKE